MGFLNPLTGAYNGGDRQPGEIPSDRPSPLHIWSVELQDWIDNPNAWLSQRVAAYPPIGDQLDAMWKGGEAAEAMKATVMAVKATYPKPGVTA